MLLEFYEIDFPPTVEHRFFDLLRTGSVPSSPTPSATASCGAIRNGSSAWSTRAPLRCSIPPRWSANTEESPRAAPSSLLELGLYHAACSDAHRTADVAEVANGMRGIEKRYGADEIEFLFCDGPRALLEGRLPE